MHAQERASEYFSLNQCAVATEHSTLSTNYKDTYMDVFRFDQRKCTVGPSDNICLRTIRPCPAHVANNSAATQRIPDEKKLNFRLVFQSNGIIG